MCSKTHLLYIYRAMSQINDHQLSKLIMQFTHSYTRLKNQFIECISVYKIKRMQPLKQMAHNKHIIEYDLINRDFGIALSIRRK